MHKLSVILPIPVKMEKIYVLSELFLSWNMNCFAFIFILHNFEDEGICSLFSVLNLDTKNDCIVNDTFGVYAIENVKTFINKETKVLYCNANLFTHLVNDSQ